MSKVIHRAAVLGAGVMGSGIAALLAAAGVQVTLLDVVPKELDEKGKGKGLTEASPAFRNRFPRPDMTAFRIPVTGMLYEKSQMANITVGNMTDDMGAWPSATGSLKSCWASGRKAFCYAAGGGTASPAPLFRPTPPACRSGDLRGLDEEFARHFLGTHFFNPPAICVCLK